MSIVIGSVPYLNARPLVDWFTETPEGRASGVEVVERVPSELHGMLEREEIACALLSSVTSFRHPEWRHAPGAAICSNGPVESVRLFSRVPISEITSVALDTSSLTSVTLIQILLKERYRLNPTYISQPPNLDTMLGIADAALLIGDNGFREYDPQLHKLDLGAEWTALTGLPFVYALWLGPPERLTEPLEAVLVRAKKWGTANVRSIAERTAAKHGKSVAGARHYMTQAIRYDLGEREEAGLRIFGSKLAQLGLV